MARNGAGVYSLPAGSAIANGDVSDASDLNSPLQDIEADMNTPRPVVAGGTGASNAADARTNLGVTLANLGGQAADPTLTALAAYNTNGLLTQTGADTFTGRSVAAGTGISVTNGNGVSGNPTVAVTGNLSSLAGLSLSAGDVLYATGANTVARLPIGTASQVLRVNAGATAPEWFTQPSTGITFSGAASASGSQIDVGSIPATAKRICVYLSGVSHNSGTSATFFVQIGDSGGIEATGYAGAFWNSIPDAGATLSTGFQITSAQGSADLIHGTLTLTLIDPANNTWAANGAFSTSGSTILSGVITGSKSLSATLDRVRILTSAGSFDAGTVNVSWE